MSIIFRQRGHANSSVTARYLGHLAPADVAAAMQRRSWQEPEAAL